MQFGPLLCILALAAVVTGLPGPSASDWYISPFGSDSNSGTSTHDAFQTLSKAISQCHPGDTIHAANGLYTGSDNTGLTLGDITLVGQSVSGTIFQGPPNSLFSFIFDSTQSTTISNLTLQGPSGHVGFERSPQVGFPTSGVYVNIDADVTLNNVTFTKLPSCVTMSYYAYSLEMSGVYGDSTTEEVLHVLDDGDEYLYWKSIIIEDSAFYGSEGLDIEFGHITSKDWTTLTFQRTDFVNGGLHLDIASQRAGPSNAIVVDSCTFANVTTTSDGACFYANLYNPPAVSNSAFSDCVAEHEGEGGAVYYKYAGSNDETFAITTSTFVNCQAQDGGAIKVANGNLDVRSSIFDGCSATAGNGGAISGTQANADDAHYFISDSVFTSCQAAVDGGFLYLADATDTSIVQLSSFSAGSCNGNGGAVSVSGNDWYEFLNVTIDSSQAGGEGGALYVSKGTAARLYGSQLTGNVAASGNGGAVVGPSHSQLQVKLCTFAENSASQYGGGVSIEGTLSVQGAAFVNNTAIYGAGLYIESSSATNALGSLFAGNVASKSGGGFYCSGGGINLSYAAFIDNEAAQGSSFTCAKNCQTFGSNIYNSSNSTVSGCNTFSHDETVLGSVRSLLAGGSL